MRSSAITNGVPLPKEFSGDGASVSPPLEWSGAPAGTKSYTLLMHHTDARGENISYWILYNLSANTQSLPKGARGVGSLGISSRGNHAGYTPPHSAGPGTRTYVFTLYALDTVLDLKPGANLKALQSAMQNHILATVKLTGLRTR